LAWLGPFCSGVLGQKIGGREALRVMAILYTISAIGCAFAWDWNACEKGGRSSEGRGG
jgi:MFS transporter, SP family, arabinose:H+ symporter